MGSLIFCRRKIPKIVLEKSPEREKYYKNLDHNKFIVGNKKIELKYEGEKKNNIRNGNGILYYSNGLCYEG